MCLLRIPDISNFETEKEKTGGIWRAPSKRRLSHQDEATTGPRLFIGDGELVPRLLQPHRQYETLLPYRIRVVRPGTGWRSILPAGALSSVGSISAIRSTSRVASTWIGRHPVF